MTAFDHQVTDNVLSDQSVGELARLVEAEDLTAGKKHGKVKNTGLSDPTIEIYRSLGAKAQNYEIALPNKETVYLTEGTRITNVEGIAGKGRNRMIDEIDALLEKYPNSSETQWQKKKGIGYVDYYGESYMAELHWYEEPSVGRVKWKLKPDKDGNWFYDD